MLDKQLMEIIACPKCTRRGSLEYNQSKNSLVCKDCKLSYPVRDGIPVMLIDEAETLAD